MNRKELYAKVKEFNLQEKIKNKYGDNYTRVGNEILEEAINAYINSSKIPLKKETPSTSVNNTIEHSCKCDKLIEVLKKKHILLNSEIDYINS